jgi:hypothetical protein
MYVFYYIFLFYVLGTWCRFFKLVEPIKTREPDKTPTLVGGCGFEAEGSHRARG